ncbi:MAG: hypothetical protein AB1916_07070 [Thermodesulfobacteriota bacterium]
MSERLRACALREWEGEWTCGADGWPCAAVWPRDPGACPRFAAGPEPCPECLGAGARVFLARDREAGWSWCPECGAWYAAAELRA